MAKTPTKKPAAQKPADKQKLDEQFDEADAKGAPTQEEIDDATLSRSIRGY